MTGDDIGREAAEGMGRLPLSFHQTFIPERHYLAKLMEFTARTGIGGTQAISEATGIPTGSSSGKVEATIHYARGMGLVRSGREVGGGWRLGLTALGERVREEDPYLSEALTQWLLHLCLCRPNGGAEVWYRVFTDGRLALGGDFTTDALKQFLMQRYGDRSSLPGPLVRMYSDPASFSQCGALDGSDGELRFHTAPSRRDFYPGYAALLLLAWDECLAGQRQVALGEFKSGTRLFEIAGWGNEETHQFLDWLNDQGVLAVDAKTGNPVLLKTLDTRSALDRLYDGLV